MSQQPHTTDDGSSRNVLFTGVLLAMAGTFLFALKSIFIKLAYAEGVEVEALLMLRMMISLPFYLAMLMYLSRQGKLPALLTGRKVVQVMALGFLGYYLASFLDLWGLTFISAQLERLTLFTYPTMIAVLAWIFLKEKITPRIALSLVLCYAGLWVMYGQEKNMAQGASVMLGVGLVLGAALSFSIYVILSKSVIHELGSRCFTSLAMIGSTFFVGIHFSIIHTPDALDVSARVWWYASLLAFVSTVIPSFMVTEAIARIGATRTTILGSVGPVFTIALAVLLLNEPTSINHLLGTVLVIIGVLFVQATL
ncbi:MAG: DMT family transporter [Hahellaceae bacterium]|nr:DMT family transporter [Hahellaceae bacterium]MCP5169742.1 DMT family transporter [Hahellaceae bacterium]